MDLSLLELNNVLGDINNLGKGGINFLNFKKSLPPSLRFLISPKTLFNPDKENSITKLSHTFFKDGSADCP